MIGILVVSILVTLLVGGPARAADQPKGRTTVKETAVIAMEKGGEITIELFPGEAPKTVANFVALAKKGFYDKLTFHRVEPGFVVQVGDRMKSVRIIEQ